MNPAVFLIILAALSGCASRPVIYKPSPVVTPISTPCLAPVVLHPEWPTNGIAPDSDIFTQTKTVLAELELRKGYEARLEASVKACQ